MSANYFKPGSWNVHCQRCGFKHKAEDIKKEWTGFLVCNECWEPRHPQEFLRGVTDDQRVPFANKDPIVFVDVTYGPDDSTIDNSPTDDAPLNDPSHHEE